MAELSEQDKRILLGPDYLAREREAEAEREARGGRASPERRRERMSNVRSSAGFVAAVAGILFLSHVFRGSANYDIRIAIGSGLICAVAVALALAAHLKMQRLD